MQKLQYALFTVIADQQQAAITRWL